MRLFGSANAAADLTPAVTERAYEPASWQWLAPAMAVFVFGLFITGSNGAFHPLDGDNFPSALAHASMTQPDYSTYYASARHSDNNALRSTFEWTNQSRSLRTTPPMPQTNSVMQ